MAFNTPLTHVENYVFGRGVCYFAEFDANGVPMGERDLGNVPGLNLTVTSSKYEHFSSRSGLAKKDLSVTVSVAFNTKVDIEDFGAENQALFIGGSSGLVDQAATPVTAERIYNIVGGREYQLGATAGNPTGVRGVGSVAVKIYELTNAVARVNSTAYALGDIFKSSTNVFLVTTAGTTAGSAPSFTTTAVGDATTDGTAEVKFIGVTAAYTIVTDYALSTESARVGIVVDGLIDQACALYLDETGDYLSLSMAYTPTANSRTQITSSSTGSVNGQFRFIADNAEGDNRDLFIASCSLAPSGDLPFITDNAVGKASFELGVNEKDSSTPQIIIDGRPL